MDQSQLKELITKISKGTANEEEFTAYNVYMNRIAPEDGSWIEETMGDSEIIKQQLWKKMQEGMQPAKLTRLWPRIAAAAILIISLSAGLFFYTHQKPAASFVKNDITPGGNMAILTLSNGKQIVLTDAKNGNLAKDNAAIISKAIDGQVQYINNTDNTTAIAYNTMSIPRRGQYTLILSDGTKVYLNSESSIKYPTSFTGKERTVELMGEAYFEVAHNTEKPFKVISGTQAVEVLGTHFNINSYLDENGITTTLLEGSVKVTGANRSKVIKPGQQASFINNNLSVTEANIEEAVAWKNGYFRFNDTRIGDIMRQLSRWYDIDVTYKGPISEEGYNGKISRYRTISQVLAMLEQTRGIHFKIEGRRVVVMR